MACKTRAAMFNDIYKRALPVIRKENPDMKGPELKAKATEAANAVIDKAQALAKETPSKEIDSAIRANASQAIQPVKAKRETVAIPVGIAKLHEEYQANPSNKTAQAIINAELAYGYRNQKGELLVNFKQPRKVLGSSIKSEITSAEFDELYTDNDGTMNSALNINDTFIEMDKENLGENFNTNHSNELSETLFKIVATVNNLQDIGIKIKPSTLTEALEAVGNYNPHTNSITIEADTKGPGVKYREEFPMTNQEVMVHELVHAVLDFMFDEDNKSITRDAQTIALTADLKALYTKAMKESTWETLLPGLKDGQKYSEAQENVAKAKWEYMFNNSDGHGLQEFTAGLLTSAMVKEGMENITSTNTKEAKADEGPVEKIQRLFLNFIERILGFATNKNDNSITKDGAALIFKIMKAHSNATEQTAVGRAIKNVETAADTVQEKLDIADSSVRKMTDPIIGAFDSVKEAVEKDKELLGKDRLAELIKYNDKVQKLLDSIKNYKPTEGNRFKKIVGNIFKILHSMIQFARALPSIYQMRKLVHGTKRSRELTEHFAKMINKLLESIGLVREGMIRGVARDLMDNPGIYNYLADSILKLTHTVDDARQSVYEGVMKDVKEAYGDVKIGNDILNLRHNEALTDVVLRPDVQSLGLNARELTELLKDPIALQQEISKRKTGLTAEQLADVDSLASYMITGNGNSNNEENIAKGFGQEKELKTTKEQIKQIDELISYKALEMVSENAKDDFIGFMDGNNYSEYSTTLWGRAKKVTGFSNKKALSKEEYLKAVDAGTNAFIDRAMGLQNASKGELRANPHDRIKGYMKETYNNDYSLEFHPMEDKEQLEKDGYVFIREAKRLNGTSKTYGMFKSNAPAVKRANGALGLQDKKSRGFTLDDIVGRESRDDTTNWDKAKRDAAKKKLFEEVLKQYREDPKSLDMQPMYSREGRIVNFRTTMSIADKKEHLEMETKGNINLARSWGHMGTASKTAIHNREVIDLLFQDKQENYNEDTAYKYITIQPKALDAEDFDLDRDTKGLSPDAKKNIQKREKNRVEMERFWARLPKDTKEYAREKFGSNQIIIKKELLTVAFGEDNYSLANSKLFEKSSPRVQAMVKVAESTWQDVMQVAKANIVIKTPEVLIGNLISNFKILLYTGVHPIQGTKLIMAAMKDLKRYENDKAELGKLVRDRIGGKKNLDNRIAELEKEMANNSVAPLIDAGMYQSIVEDVDTSGELNRTAKIFDKKLDKYITNETANTAMQYLFLTQKTKPYQQLLKATQVSDFYFRYAQYYSEVEKETAKVGLGKVNGSWSYDTRKHAQAAGKDGKTSPSQHAGEIEKKAMRNAIDNFINYEVPLEKHVRYGDAMGTWFFVKYFVKIQRVVKKLAKEHPFRLALDIAIQQFITGDTPDVLDASFIDKGFSTYNPLNVGDRIMEVITPSGYGLVAGK